MSEEPKKIYTTIQIKRRLTGEPGPPTDLAPGELAMNETTDTLFVGTTETPSPLLSTTSIDMGIY